MSFPPSASLSLSLPFSLPPSASLSVSLCFSLRLSCKRLKAISLLWLWFHSCKDGAPIIGLSWSGCIYTAIYIAIYEFAVTITKRSFKETSLFTDVMVHMQLRVPYLSVFLFSRWDSSKTFSSWDCAFRFCITWIPRTFASYYMMMKLYCTFRTKTEINLVAGGECVWQVRVTIRVLGVMFDIQVS